MPALPYLISLSDRNPLNADLGVQGARVMSMVEGAIRVFYSQLEGRVPATPESLQVEVLRFHAVVDSVFQHTGVIPFRFPTLLLDEQALREHCSLHEVRYVEDLRRLDDFVQMEIHFPPVEAAAVPEGHARTTLSPGTAFLRDRQARSQSACSQLEDLKTHVSKDIEWRDRETSGGLRAYALVRRSDAEDFRSRLQLLSSIKVRLTGPWPPTEFLPSSYATSK